MKNKKNLYILLPAVIIVWGLVIYRFFKGMNPDTSLNQKAQTVKEFNPEELKESETFTIKADYRDPFLGSLAKKEKKIKRSYIPSKPKEPEIPFPNIVYKGIISPKGKKEKVFLININGQQQLFKLKNTLNQVTLLRGNEEQITLKFQKEKRTFQLQK